jgi:hypothetical protein
MLESARRSGKPALRKHFFSSDNVRNSQDYRCMIWTVQAGLTPRFVAVKISGPMNADELRNMVANVISLGKANRTASFLVDATDAIHSVSLFDVFNIPALQFRAEGLAYGSRIALIEPKNPAARHSVDFFADCCVTRGWRAAVFATRDDAIEWLGKQEDAGPSPPHAQGQSSQ